MEDDNYLIMMATMVMNFTDNRLVSINNSNHRSHQKDDTSTKRKEGLTYEQCPPFILEGSQLGRYHV